MQVHGSEPWQSEHGKELARCDYQAAINQCKGREGKEGQLGVGRDGHKAQDPCQYGHGYSVKERVGFDLQVGADAKQAWKDQTRRDILAIKFQMEDGRAVLEKVFQPSAGDRSFS
jgi:hypothetical protein